MEKSRQSHVVALPHDDCMLLVSGPAALYRVFGWTGLFLDTGGRTVDVGHVCIGYNAVFPNMRICVYVGKKQLICAFA